MRLSEGGTVRHKGSCTILSPPPPSLSRIGSPTRNSPEGLPPAGRAAESRAPVNPGLVAADATVTFCSVDDDPTGIAGVRQGDVLAGKYRVERVLGVGGMGVVVAAHHLQLDEKVALKFLLPEMLVSDEAVTRFAREARAAARIKSEHVARVFDVGILENGSPYMVLEYLEGEDLGAQLQRCGPLPIGNAVDFILQTCVAVADAHALGIVHRDLKPANLFCVRRSDGQMLIKVLDFGISKTDVPGAASPGRFTRTSALMGSPVYMSPEQMQTPKDVDARTDIWALGIVLYELLAGSPPFEGETVPQISVRVATQPPTPLRGVRADTPMGLEDVVNRCLEKDRGRRYRDVGELAAALLPFAPDHARPLVQRVSGILGTSVPSLPVGTQFDIPEVGASSQRSAAPSLNQSTSFPVPSPRSGPEDATRQASGIRTTGGASVLDTAPASRLPWAFASLAALALVGATVLALQRSHVSGTVPSARNDDASVGASQGATAPSNGGSLSEDDVIGVVRNHQTSVKRNCWDRLTSTAPSVNVTVNAIVASSGEVSSVHASGNEPAVSRCVEDEVRGWHFPGGGAAQIPFHFIRTDQARPAADPQGQALISGTSSSGASGAQLTEDDVNRVVRRYQTGIKRSCWDRADPQQTAASVSVTVNVTVTSSGQVSSASATGNDPGVAHCVEEEVKGWHFPGGGVVGIPFHFFRQ